MRSIEKISNTKICYLLEKHPFLNNFFTDNDLKIEGKEDLTLNEFFALFDEDDIENKALDIPNTLFQISEYIKQMLEFLGGNGDDVKKVTILPGKDKFENDEQFEELIIKQGEIICIVGPTGSGKSRLLADIEWVAQRDTPTNRKVLINNEIPDKKWRFSSSEKLVAQLSQNMNFVMDLTVYEFVELHAESRLVENKEDIINKIIAQANNLAGEGFHKDTPITSLSGGQSRALMIADTAILSKSPIILIDEIENAGIDRKRALNLLISEDKIVLMATHDPILALMGDKRIVIKNGGVFKIIETTENEREILKTLEKMDKTLLAYRTKLRQGEIISKVEEDK